MLQHNPALRAKIDQLWDKFWTGGITNPLSVIEQITYLLFMKRIDELDAKRQADAAWSGQAYRSHFSGHWIPPEERHLPPAQQRPIPKQSLRWSEFKRMPAEAMLQHLSSRVFPFLKDLGGDAHTHFAQHMRNAVFTIPKPSLLVEAVKTVDDIFALVETEAREKGQLFQDIQGDVYEYLLSEIATSGKNGQFRTPRHIIKLMLELAAPEFGHRIADPACGTGGFLLGAYHYLITQLARRTGAPLPPPDEDGFVRSGLAAALTAERLQILNDSLYGYDIDATMVRLGLMNLMMHGLDSPHIDYRDTLSSTFNEDAAYHCVLANPPFKGSLDKADINPALQLPTTKTELLFVETICRMLRRGGTACVIVPQGVLFDSDHAFKQLRRQLIERCELKAVITLPSGVFKPYAGVSTAILLFTKVYGTADKVRHPATDQVWFYEVESDGYSLDDKRTKLPHTGDLQDVIEKFRTRTTKPESNATPATTSSNEAATRVGETAESISQPPAATGKGFLVSRAEIEAQSYDLSPARYRQQPHEEQTYPPPTEILENLINSEIGDAPPEKLADLQAGGILKELIELKEMLG